MVSNNNKILTAKKRERFKLLPQKLIQIRIRGDTNEKKAYWLLKFHFRKYVLILMITSHQQNLCQTVWQHWPDIIYRKNDMKTKTCSILVPADLLREVEEDLTYIARVKRTIASSANIVKSSQKNDMKTKTCSLFSVQCWSPGLFWNTIQPDFLNYIFSNFFSSFTTLTE